MRRTTWPPSLHVQSASWRQGCTSDEWWEGCTPGLLLAAAEAGAGLPCLSCSTSACSTMAVVPEVHHPISTVNYSSFASATKSVVRQGRFCFCHQECEPGRVSFGVVCGRPFRSRTRQRLCVACVPCVPALPYPGTTTFAVLLFYVINCMLHLALKLNRHLRFSHQTNT